MDPSDEPAVIKRERLTHLANKNQYLVPDWPAPRSIRALVTTRQAGFSGEPYQSFNLASHVGDSDDQVRQNRALLQNDIGQSNHLHWLDQQHTNICKNIDALATRSPTDAKTKAAINTTPPIADASCTSMNNHVCAVLTADCLPILICNKKGSWVAACHAGWRGLASGVLQNCINSYCGAKSELMAWIGPAISQEYFEVGIDVRARFSHLGDSYKHFFIENNRARYQFDFIGLARQMLTDKGVDAFGGAHCSFGDNDRFYSYRRDGVTGRMASLIWIE